MAYYLIDMLAFWKHVFITTINFSVCRLIVKMVLFKQC